MSMFNRGFCQVPFPNLSPSVTNSSSAGSKTPSEIRMQCDPFVRLMTFPTKAWMLKKIENHCAPKDSLDLALSACYDHHRQFWAPRAQTVHQCATYHLYPWGRCQAKICRMQNFKQCNVPSDDGELGNYLRVAINPYNDKNLEIGVGSPHVSNANAGYGRSAGGQPYST